jgi:hypothetical protein
MLSEDTPTMPAIKSRPVLLTTGIVSVLFASILAIRLIWEETSLTWQQEPQMVGFSLAHGSGALLLVAPFVLAIWLVVALIVVVLTLLRRRRLPTAIWCCFASGVLVIGLLSMPEALWQWLLISEFAKSPHAADLVTYAAAEGDVRTVRGYLKHGVSVESKNYEGSTPAFTAAAGGSVTVLQLLEKQKANFNAVNSYGDSPLEAAVEGHHDAAATFLKSHGALQVRGTEQQRHAASEAIVRKEIERMHSPP